MTPEQRRVLTALRDGGRCSIYEIAERSGLAPITANVMLGYPEGFSKNLPKMPEQFVDGFLETWTRTTYCITEQGRRALAEAEGEREEVEHG